MLWLIGCAASGEEVAAVAPPPTDPFAEWLAAPIPVADGFSAPVTGWDRCGDGCWSRGRAGEVHAIANGVVRGVDPLRTEHLWYDDQVKHTATFTWEGVSTSLAIGATVKRGATVGTAKELYLTGEDAIDTFLASRSRLPVPQAERVLALVSHDTRQLRLYVDHREIGTFEVGLGQAAGDKEKRGDNRTPKGVYFVVARSQGPFDGDYAAYYGGYWIKLGYPNPWDAARGVDAGLFDADVQRTITRSFWNRGTPLQGTKLGGGIGLHGWAYEWDDADPRRMSWGCVVMHLRDAPTIYANLTEGAMVALF